MWLCHTVVNGGGQQQLHTREKKMPIETVDTFGPKLAIRMTPLDDKTCMPHTMYLKKSEVRKILEELVFGGKTVRDWAKDLEFEVKYKDW